MSLQPTTLRLAGGLGALLVCGGAGASVAADQHPAGAPLRPPVSRGPAPLAAATSGGLVIPPTPVCSGRRLSGLSADQRQQATALIQRRARAAGGASCRGAAGGPPGAGGGQPIVPEVGDAGTSGQPVTFTDVS